MVDSRETQGANKPASLHQLSADKVSGDVLNNIVKTVPDLIFTLDLSKMQLQYCNRDIFRDFGWDLDYWSLSDEQRSEQWRKMLHPDDAAVLGDPAGFAHLFEQHGTLQNVIRMRGADGKWRYFQTHSSQLYSDKDQLGEIVVVARDITERRKLNAEHRMAAKVFENSSDGIMILDSHSCISQVNVALTKITGYDESELLGQSPVGLLLPAEDDSDIAQDSLNLVSVSGLYEQALEQGFAQGEDLGLRKSGDAFHSITSVTVIAETDGSGSVQSVIITMRDITESKTHEERIRHLAYYDALTDLPNRTLFHDRLEHELLRCERNGHFAALLFLDLDKFKAVNDSLGHAAGDKLLSIASARLKDNVRSEDTVARMSGDEFTIILSGRQSKDHITAAASHVARKILREMAEPFPLDGHEVFVSVSVGVSIYPEDGTTPSRLLRNADTAMYFAKEAGKNNFQFYTPRMNAHSIEQLEFQNNLHQAVADQEFEVFFQPQYDYKTQALTTVESLLRWRQPDGRLVSPLKFLPLAEQSGLIIRMGEWLIERSLWQFSEWRSMGMPVERLAINLSARQFGDDKLVEFVSQLLEKYNIPAEQVEFELTESVLMADIAITRSVMEKLKALGVTVVIDDFGTGYSSLNYLKELPIDALKIDGSFVSCLPGGREDQQIIKVIVALAEGFDLRVIAEGVETAEQSAYLEALGCSAAQGYLFAGPQPAYDLEQMLLGEANAESQHKSA